MNGKRTLNVQPKANIDKVTWKINQWLMDRMIESSDKNYIFPFLSDHNHSYIFLEAAHVHPSGCWVARVFMQIQRIRQHVEGIFNLSTGTIHLILFLYNHLNKLSATVKREAAQNPVAVSKADIFFINKTCIWSSLKLNGQTKINSLSCVQRFHSHLQAIFSCNLCCRLEVCSSKPDNEPYACGQWQIRHYQRWNERQKSIALVSFMVKSKVNR